MSNFTMKSKAGRVPVNWSTFIGEKGNIFWDMNTGALRLSDGETPGGINIAGVGNTSLGNIAITDQNITGTVANANIYITPDGTGEVIIQNLKLGNLVVTDQTITGTNVNGDITISPNGVGLVSAPGFKVPVGSVISGSTGAAILVTPLILDSVLQTSTGSALPDGTYGNTGSIPAPWTAYRFTTDPSPVLQLNDVLSGAGVPILSSVVFVGTGGNSKIVVVNTTLTGLPAPQLPVPGQNMYISRATVHDTLTLATAANTDVLFTPGSGGLTVSGASILPAADSSYDLGNPLRRWREVYMGPSSLFMMDAATNVDISLKANSGNLNVFGARGINVGEFRIYDNNINLTDPTRDIIIGSAAASGYVNFNRPLRITAGGTDVIVFQASRDGLVKIRTPGTILTTQAALEINGSTSGNSQPRNFTGTLLQLTAQDGTAARVSIDSFGTETANAYPVIAGRRARGTVDAPTATQADDTLFRISTQGYGSTGYVSSIARMSMQATQNFTDTHGGTRVRFQVTPTDSTTIQAATMDLTANGISFLNNATGGIRYPDNSFQNTAYTGSIASSNITGNVVLKISAGTGLSASGTDLTGGSWTGNVSLNTTDVHSITAADNVNQVIVTNDGVNNITLGLPQDISASSSPTFVDVYVTNIHVTGNTFSDNPVVSVEKTIYLANSATANTEINNGGLVLGTGAFQRHILYRLDSGVDYWDTGTAGFLTSNLGAANANVANLRVTNQGHFGTLAEIGDFANAVVQVDANTATFAQIVIMNHGDGTGASADVVATSDLGDDNSYYIDMGINSSNYDGSPDWTISAANDAYLYNKDGNLTVGTATAGKKISFHTGGTTAADIRATITDTGISTPLQITSTLATGTAPFVVTSTTTVANLHVANATYATSAGSADSATTAGTVTTAAQPNITSTGTLTSLNVNAQMNATVFSSNIATGTAPFKVLSTTQVANLNVAAAGTAITVTAAAQPNITSVGSLAALTVTGNANVGNIGTTGVFVGNLTGSAATVTASSQPNITSLGTLTALSVTGNISGANVNGNLYGNVTGNVSGSAATVTTAAQPNITSIGTLASLTVSGNIGAGNVNANLFGTLSGNVVNGNSSVNITANSNVTITATSNATMTITGTGANIAGTANVTGNANVGNLGTGGLIVATGNVSGGNLTTGGALSVTGNANVGNLGTAGSISATGNITATANLTAGNISTGGVLSVTGNANVGNLGTAGLVVATGNVTGGNLVTGGALSVTGNANTGNLGTTTIIATTANLTTINGALHQNGTSNVTINNNGNVNISVGGNVLTVTSTGANISGTTNVTGNANVGNLGTSGLVVATGNITGGNLVTGGVLSVTGNANVGNLGTNGLVVATGNITGGNLVTGGVLSVTGNANVGNLGTNGLVVATGNITGGNLITGGVLSVTGNANVGNLGTARILASGNITASQLISNVATGTAPLVVTSNTQVANMNVAVSGTATNLSAASSILAGSLSISPAQVNKNNTSTQTFTLTDLTTNHKIVITCGTSIVFGLYVKSAWASAANTLSIEFENATGGNITPPTLNIQYFAWV